MLQPNSKTWNTIIKNYSLDFKHYEALSLYIQKSKVSFPIKPDHQVLALLLKSCAALSFINLGKCFHSHIIKLGHIYCQTISKAVLNMYAKCGAFDECKFVFGQMGNADPVAWNIVLSGFSGSGIYDAKVMKLFKEMIRKNGPRPNEISVAVVLPICARFRDLYLGKNVHSYIIKSGLESKTLVGNALVSMYAKCCRFVLNDAYAAFQGIQYKDVVSWNAIIAGFAENNSFSDAFNLFTKMVKSQVQPNYATIANVLPVCASLDNILSYICGKEIHCYVMRRNGLMVDDVSISNALISFYLRKKRTSEAENIFRRMKSRDLVSWNAIIAGYSSNDDSLRALELFHEFLSVGMLTPDYVTLVSVLSACAQLSYLKLGKEIHGFTIRSQYLRDNTTLGNAILSFYTKCDEIDAVFNAFVMNNKKDLITWNTMLDALSKFEYETQFIDILQSMLKEEGLKPDSITILSILQFSSLNLNLDKVKETHCYSLKSGLLLQVDTEPTLGNAILNAYAKCGNMGYAHAIFECLSEKKNVVTCNSMISGYVNCGSHDEAYTIFTNMPQKDLTTWNLMIRVYAENDFPTQAFELLFELQDRGMKPDSVTLMTVLTLCAQTASIHLLRQCHGYVVRSCFEDLHLKGALIHLYTKCGSVDTAYKLFLASPDKDLAMFTAMIGGYAMNGMGEESLKIFSYMLEFGLKPDHVILTSVLSACSHSGLLNEGWDIFNSIEDIHKMKPTMEQYACVVDLLARSGKIKEAYTFVNNMPIQATANVWGTLLGACKKYHEVELGRDVANRLFEIESKNIGNYVVMSNIYAADNKWDRVMEIRKMMRSRELKKPAGCSWIEVDRRKNVFVAGDLSHQLRNVIYDTLSILDQQIKEPLDV